MQPRIALPEEVIPGVPWDKAFRDDFNKWSLEFFGPKEDATEPTPSATHDAVLSLDAWKPKRTKPRKKTQETPDLETFSELLANLSDAFNSLKIPPIKGNWVPKKDIASLYKLGIHVPNPWLLEWVNGDVFVDKAHRPNIASVHFTRKQFDKDGVVHPRFLFAIKAAELPINVEQVKGTPYRFGASFELPKQEGDENSPARLFWCYCFVVITPNGLVVIPSERAQTSSRIIHKRRQPGLSGHGQRAGSFIAKEWRRPTLVTPDEKTNQSGQELEQLMAVCFRQLLKWWSTRSDRWSVAVKKDGYRVTFSVDPEHTSTYFADRDKTIKAADGTAKKIIHFVREHTRSNGATVKAHVRGIREFDWLGYHCLVTAPKFTGHLFSASFEAPPVTDEEAKTIGERNLIDFNAIAPMLAAAEDEDTRKRA